MIIDQIPVNCGCGGKPFVDGIGDGYFMVRCRECKIETAAYKGYRTAIAAWNKAMSKRTAKAVKGKLDHDVTIGSVTFKKGTSVLSECSECGNYVRPGDNYCVSCGARLEWK